MRLSEQAKTYLGVPYRHRGRKPSGLDCAGLPWRCYADLGHVLPDIRNYGREPHKDGLMQACIDALGEPVWTGKGCRISDLRVDDVAVLAFTLEPHHLGVVGQGEFGLSIIHADGTLGVSKVVIQRFTPERLKQVVAIFRKPV
jgi:hypothetical protein